MGKIVRALSTDGSVFCAAIDSTDIVAEIFSIHKTTPVASAALGRLATAGALMGSFMKSDSDRLTLRIKGDGPGGLMVVVADNYGNIKCYAEHANANLPLNGNGKLDVGQYVGKNGFLSVVKDLGLKEPYSSQIPIVTGEIAEDIAAFYAVSEQIPTVCALGVLVDIDWSIKTAGGYIIQLLPPINEGAIDIIEANIKNMPSVSEMLMNGITIEEIALKGLEGLDGEILDTFEGKFSCDCSRERTKSLIFSLGKQDIEELVKDKQETEVCCHFCNKKYKFSHDEIKEMIS